MFITEDRRPQLQVGDAQPSPIDRCEVHRDVDRSLLTAVIRNGEPVTFVSGQLVTLWADDSVVFQGRAIDEYNVLDLISTADDSDLADGEQI
ncbi:MAG: hypothetical protein GX537_04790 [Actinobacteria bacterium]|nr:hypothetical protein [Actinomycetota bacterium]